MGLLHGWISERAVASVAEKRVDLVERFALICQFAISMSSSKCRNRNALLTFSGMRHRIQRS